MNRKRKPVQVPKTKWTKELERKIYPLYYAYRVRCIRAGVEAEEFIRWRGDVEDWINERLNRPEDEWTPETISEGVTHQSLSHYRNEMEAI